jgi:hypothetical protein
MYDRTRRCTGGQQAAPLSITIRASVPQHSALHLLERQEPTISGSGDLDSNGSKFVPSAELDLYVRLLQIPYVNGGPRSALYAER